MSMLKRICAVSTPIFGKSVKSLGSFKSSYACRSFSGSASAPKSKITTAKPITPIKISPEFIEESEKAISDRFEEIFKTIDAKKNEPESPKVKAQSKKDIKKVH